MIILYLIIVTVTRFIRCEINIIFYQREKYIQSIPRNRMMLQTVRMNMQCIKQSFCINTKFLKPLVFALHFFPRPIIFFKNYQFVYYSGHSLLEY